MWDLKKLVEFIIEMNHADVSNEVIIKLIKRFRTYFEYPATYSWSYSNNLNTNTATTNTSNYASYLDDAMIRSYVKRLEEDDD